MAGDRIHTIMTEKPHLLVIGVGSIGERHLRCFQSTDRCTLSFCEPTESRRRDVATRYDARGFDSWENAVAAENFDAAVIASPAPYHIPTAQALADKGLDLLIEKPLSLSMEGIEAFAETIRQKKNRVSVGFIYRCLPALQQLVAAAKSGEYGRIVQIQVHSGQHFPFYRPAYREIYYADPAQGGGLIQDMLPHHMNVVEWIAGPTTQVVVDASHQVLPGVDVEDTVNLLTRHSDVMASFTLNQHQPVNEFSVTVNCDRGALRWELDGHRWLSATENGGSWVEQAAFVHERDDYYVMQANAFLDLVAGTGNPSCSLSDAIQTLKSTLAILKSKQTGRWEHTSGV